MFQKFDFKHFRRFAHLKVQRCVGCWLVQLKIQAQNQNQNHALTLENDWKSFPRNDHLLFFNLCSTPSSIVSNQMIWKRAEKANLDVVLNWDSNRCQDGRCRWIFTVPRYQTPKSLFQGNQCINYFGNLMSRLAVVVAQLVEWLLPIPEVCSLNPVIGKYLSEQNGVSERSEITLFWER